MPCGTRNFPAEKFLCPAPVAPTKFPLKEYPVGAKVYMFLAMENSRDKFTNFRIDEWFAAADADNRGPCLVHTLQAFLYGKFFLDSGSIFSDTAATRAGEVAGV